MKRQPEGKRKPTRFHYSLYWLVGFVLVALKDVMKLLEDNLQETESLPQPWRPEPFSGSVNRGTKRA